jgi:hypothetical protein
MGSIIGFLSSSGDFSQGVRFDDASEAMALRELRQQASMNPDARFVATRDGDMTYDLYVRDELPADVDQALTVFEADASLLMLR